MLNALPSPFYGVVRGHFSSSTYATILVNKYNNSYADAIVLPDSSKTIYQYVNQGGTVTVENLNGLTSFTSTTYDSTKLVNVSGVKKGSVCSVVVTIKSGLSVGWYNATVTGIPSNYFPAGIVYGSHRINSSADQDKYAYAQLDTGGTISFYCGGGFSADIPFSFTYVV